jgi:hypothetical protein
MIHIDILFELAAIFPKYKMAAVSHIGYVPTFKYRQLCIEMTTQTHSDNFWSSVIACHVAAMSLQSGLCSINQPQAAILKNDKMTKIPYSSDQSFPNKGFCMPK